MGKKRTGGRLSEFTKDELIAELARRRALELPEDFTMTDVELAVAQMHGEEGPPKLAAMLSRMKPEKPTAKSCPRCGKRIPVKARDRERTVRSLAGPVTFRRNYHYCKDCEYGFYPVDQLLGLPEEGELTAEMEKRVLDFAVNSPFEHIAERWSVHYPTPVSANLARRVLSRVGVLCEEADELELQQALLPEPAQPSSLLIVQADGSMLPLRERERWKEAKVAVIVRGENHARRRRQRRGHVSQARYIAVLGDQDEFAHSLRQALAVKKAAQATTVAWLGDGAPENWTLADGLTHGNCVQILDAQHAIENGMKAGRALLGEQSLMLPLWQRRIEQLLYAGNPEQLISEVLDCIVDADDEQLAALDDLVRYYRANATRMLYRDYIERGLPIGSGMVESAHRHVLQIRMKLAGQHWSLAGARRMTRLRAAYRTAGPRSFHAAIRSVRRLSAVTAPRVGLALCVGQTRDTYTRQRASRNATTGVPLPPKFRRKASN